METGTPESALGKCQKGPCMWDMLANSCGWWGKESNHLNKWGKPEVFDKRMIQKTSNHFTHANLVVVT